METIHNLLSRPSAPPDARVVYGGESCQFGELRLPTGRHGPLPVVVVIHGGFWRSRYSLALMNPVAAALTSAGVATWNIEYRRIGNPGGGWPGTFQDVAQAVDYLRDMGPAHNLDLRRVVTLGHSAGGHLALWAAGRSRSDQGSPRTEASPLPIQGAVSLAGVTDLRRAFELGLSDGIVATLMGGAPDEVPERYAASNPSQLLPMGIPQVLVHGTHDPTVPFEVSQRYQSSATQMGDEVTLVTLPGAGHFEVIDPRSQEWPIVVETVRSLLENTPQAKPRKPV
jgi:acetyl esterase/lipase